ncbi:PQ loop repeat family protein [Candida parapsilosis]|uniref:Solute carrier family 66 member 3 n=1 Tax=Candida parapsilosis TaxID=5480 RepID=A0A8X7TDB8_CANPA|nr:PQ loop repeat family protein [Candida parapsilosis]KAF6056660.1 PQ loop repeat family protein [Candida parapsilosis]KAF6059595.1 PQ loop repeat family protein [Candida parapsilosis]KAF6068348.1 PQ loop repeat family protein [Candida parapsilosis]KAI5903045.1 hypothetical protein K4G60_g2190 [Candida parapsilosis]
MAPPNPLWLLLDLLKDPDTNNKIVLQMAWSQVKAIGYGKVLAALLSALTVGVSSFIRIPQIRKLLIKTEADRVRVAKGLSLQSLTIDTLNSLVHVSFNSHNGIPFINYGESLLLGIQNAIIILLTKYYRLRANDEIDNVSKLPLSEAIKELTDGLAQPLLIMAGSVIFFTKIAPSSLISALEILNIPISIISKIPQIKTNHRLQTVSHLSDVVLRANVLGSIIRVYTSYTDYSSKAKRNKNTVDEKILVAGYTTSLIMNSILLGQSIVYDKLGRGRRVKDDEVKKE